MVLNKEMRKRKCTNKPEGILSEVARACQKEPAEEERLEGTSCYSQLKFRCDKKFEIDKLNAHIASCWIKPQTFYNTKNYDFYL